MLYRIYIESSSEYNCKTLAIISSYYKSYTWFHVSGQREDKPEQTLVIEIIPMGPMKDHDNNIRIMCERIARINKQDSVLVIKTEPTIRFY